MARQGTQLKVTALVGAPVTPNELNDGKAAFPEFHHLYIDPGSFKHYQETGHFRDGTLIVKELASVGAKKSASGNGYFPGEFDESQIPLSLEHETPAMAMSWAFLM